MPERMQHQIYTHTRVNLADILLKKLHFSDFCPTDKSVCIAVIRFLKIE
jgi:hypothetical protein